MNKVYKLLVVFIFFASIAKTQSLPLTVEKDRKGILYGAFGSHRIFYTPGDIQFIRSSDPAFNFTLEKVKAKDEGGVKFKTAPQFSYTVGYYFIKKNFGIEYQYDHIKYFAQQNQLVHLKGTIDERNYDKDTLLTPGFVQLEHSDGGNYAMLNVVKWKTLASSQSKKSLLRLIMKAGVGLVNPKTNSTILGNHRDDRYHISGYVIGLESGLQYNFLRYAFVSGSFKGAFANYNHFLIDKGWGRQKWFSAQLIYLLGLQFPL